MKKIITMAAIMALIAMGASAAVIQEWNFTENGSGIASTSSETGLATGFFGTDSVASDGAFTVDRANGTAGDVALGTTMNQSTYNSIEISVTLASMSVGSIAGDDFFSVKLRTDVGNTVRADLTAKEQDGFDRIRMTGEAVGGVIVDAETMGPITYGITLDLQNDTYTYWVGTPTSDGSTWASRYANYTGAWDIGDADIDAVQWAVTGFSDGGGTGNELLLDQIKITAEVIPEPATLGMVAAFGGAILFIRRRLMI